VKRKESGGTADRSRIARALTRFEPPQAWDPLHRSCYALGDATLAVESDRRSFQDRFLENYRGCVVPSVHHEPDVVLQVMTLAGEVVLATCESRTGASPPGFPAIFLPARHAVRRAAARGWRIAELDHPLGCVAYGAHGVVAAVDSPWEALVASVAVNRALAAQPQIMFFHGAALGVNGKGVLLLGVSGSGKTSVSLALAARGHDFYGDDIVGVRLDSRSIVPLRRAAHIRNGPVAPGVAKALAHSGDSLSGGRLADVASLFPQSGSAAAELDVVVCLRRFTSNTHLTRFTPRARDLAWVTPHAGSLYAGEKAERAMRIVSLLAASTCFFLDSGSPESAAEAVEQITE
jgi:hypothetical protein